MKGTLYRHLSEFTLGRQGLLFQEDEPKTELREKNYSGQEIPYFINEFWTAKQRQAARIHEISYRACFKAQLPRFFIKLFTNEGDLIYDPFSGRGTTAIEAGILGRKIVSNDINPLSRILTEPRLLIPAMSNIERRLKSLDLNEVKEAGIDLSMFYHPKTEEEIASLRHYLKERKDKGKEDEIDKWIRMVATNRLTGHSKGFFSVYTLPPNQATTQERQKKINEKRDQKPEYRNVKKLILRKTKTLLGGLTKGQVDKLREAGKNAHFITADARYTRSIESDSVDLTVTSPPFLNIVQYANDNWLRCWFNNIDVNEVEKSITVTNDLDEWSRIMGDVLKELFRITKKGGLVAFEVGELRKGKIKLDEYIVPKGLKAGFKCLGVVINSQEFTKTSNIWGIDNNEIGTNTNRIVIFSKTE